MTDPLISIEDALARHGQPGVIIVDATYGLPGEGITPAVLFAKERIDGAVLFDVDVIADASAPLPHTMPDAATFEKHARALGINNASEVIVYDRSPAYLSARAWFMLRLFGHENTRLLNGGFAGWLTAGGATASGEATALPTGDFTARTDSNGYAVILLDEMKKITAMPDDQRAVQILDARGRGRFTGEEPEPRPGMKSGHMPGAMNVPIGKLIDRETGLIRPRAELEKVFGAVDATRPIVTSCGSGMTACGLALGLAVIGIENVTLYDGSWSEWGMCEDCPVEQG